MRTLLLLFVAACTSTATPPPDAPAPTASATPSAAKAAPSSTQVDLATSAQLGALGKPQPPGPPRPFPTSSATAPPNPPLSIGTKCARTADCGPNPAQACLQTSFGVPLPGGLCTASCVSQIDCGPAETMTCGTPRGSAYPGIPDHCLQRCDPKAKPTGCRDGYMCRPLDRAGQQTSESVCWAPIPG